MPWWLQRLEPTHHIDYAFFGGRRYWTHFCSSAHCCDCAGTGIRLDRLRVHRVLLCRIGRWARIDRNRCRDDSAKTAYEALRAQIPGLPPLTTIFVTHAHWDH